MRPVLSCVLSVAGVLAFLSYQWLKYLHFAAVIGFVAVHGASITVLYVIRGERDRGRIENLLAFSAKTVIPMYASLVAVVLTGMFIGLKLPIFFRQTWFWLSIGLLAATSLLMLFVAKPFGVRVRAACELRPSGIPRVSDEELKKILGSPRTHAIMAIGVSGLAGILYLMVFQPAL